MNSEIITQSNVDEIVSTVTTICKSLSDYNFENDNYINEITRRLCENNNLLHQALKETCSQIDLDSADNKRINASKVIFQELESKVLWPDKLIAEAANRVLDRLKYYKSRVTYLSYNSESNIIHSLIKSLRNPDLAQYIAIIPGLQLLVDQLEKAQFSFERSFMKYISKKEERKDSLSAIRVGNKIVDQINKELLVYLKTMANINPKMYFDCYSVIETIIINNNKRVERRLKFLAEIALKEINN